jgi:3-hydroxyacyl-CoA dehydrogenase
VISTCASASGTAVVQKEAPGFVGNRLQIALFREALSVVAQGIAG